MDMLYNKYSNPLEFMKIYINQGRFGEFVDFIINIEVKKRIEQAEKENEDKLFQMYIHSYSDKTFEEWKDNAVTGNGNAPTSNSLSMTDQEIDDEINKTRNILRNFKI